MATKKKQPADLSTAILVQIRDELRQANEKIDRTNEKLDGLDEHFSARFDELNRLRVESEMRLATALTALSQAMADIKSGILELRSERLNKLEGRVQAIEEKIAS